MTHSNSRPHNIDSRNAAETRGGDAPGFPALFQFLVNAVRAVLLRLSRTRGPKARRALVITLMLLMTLHGGTREEKAAFLKDLIERHEETLDRIYARYRIWRQRQCWMWGGGFYAGALSALPKAFTGARVPKSFDALIPD